LASVSADHSGPSIGKATADGEINERGLAAAQENTTLENSMQNGMSVPPIVVPASRPVNGSHIHLRFHFVVVICCAL
jgi:hypothetical protein